MRKQFRWVLNELNPLIGHWIVSIAVGQKKGMQHWVLRFLVLRFELKRNSKMVLRRIMLHILHGKILWKNKSKS